MLNGFASSNISSVRWCGMPGQIGQTLDWSFALSKGRNIERLQLGEVAFVSPISCKLVQFQVLNLLDHMNEY